MISTTWTSTVDVALGIGCPGGCGPRTAVLHDSVQAATVHISGHLTGPGQGTRTLQGSAALAKPPRPLESP